MGVMNDADDAIAAIEALATSTIETTGAIRRLKEAQDDLQTAEDLLHSIVTKECEDLNIDLE